MALSLSPLKKPLKHAGVPLDTDQTAAMQMWRDTGTTTPAYYRGSDRHRLVSNLLFRMGASAVLLTNKPSLRAKAKYRLLHRCRVHSGPSDEAFKWALRDVREVHEAWGHRLSEAERAALEVARGVDVRHGWAHVAARLVFTCAMMLLVACIHTAMLRGGGEGEL
ncbi:3-ketoacyl-CoA synthase 17 [Tetrabaena socialis]|uniref:3-ketoacyl-CoA synthase 17 n=1 Tax=Tetrabaena socialis TaxID=47790 RepID=A0A2J7ZXZ6_9CHLO|nr:3-ketoacyl-CoA synthase 17 [Tetrabaena socialis]|eukprot:PNH05138.1 3-ketoacyl-CoA synthase 17 [Tetrabaena socialis]